MGTHEWRLRRTLKDAKTYTFLFGISLAEGLYMASVGVPFVWLSHVTSTSTLIAMLIYWHWWTQLCRQRPNINELVDVFS